MKTSQMRIPKTRTGAIMGPGGQIINRIQAESGADISLDMIVNENNERILKIEGTDDQIKQARLLLEKSIRDQEGRGLQDRKYRVMVTGLPPTGSWQDLKDHMRDAGDVCYTDVFKDGSGTVEYLRREDMKYALKKLDDTKFKSHEVREEIAGEGC